MSMPKTGGLPVELLTVDGGIEIIEPSETHVYFVGAVLGKNGAASPHRVEWTGGAPEVVWDSPELPIRDFALGATEVFIAETSGGEVPAQRRASETLRSMTPPCSGSTGVKDRFPRAVVGSSP